MKTNPTGPDGTPIETRAIRQDELDCILMRCWPEDEQAIERLFGEQGTMGMAAWEGDRSVGMLHCYRVKAPDGHNPHWPEWNDWWTEGERTFGRWGARKADLGVEGPAWCHACLHVGRTLATRESDLPDERYWGRGIGTALIEASVDWAAEGDYAAVIAAGAPPGLWHFAVWSGMMPLATYERLGFEPFVGDLQSEEDAPGWARGQIHEPIASELREALEAGRDLADILPRTMVRRLR